MRAHAGPCPSLVMRLWLLSSLCACGASPLAPDLDAASPAADLAPPDLARAEGVRNLVLVGGGLQDDNAAVYERIIALAGGRGAARIGVITAASLPDSQDPRAGTPDASNARDNGAYYAALLTTRYGAAEAVWLPIDLDRVSNNANPAVVATAQRMSGFFFGGGDQSRLTTCLQTAERGDSPVLAALRARHAQGAVVAGTSAGTAILAAVPMITGGESYPALRFGAMEQASASGDQLSYDPRGGFALFPYGILDTHFGQRGRQGRALRLAFDRRVDLAFGVDEDTALLALSVGTAQARLEVLGRGGVGVFDLRSASLSGERFGLRGIRASYLTSGDVMDPRTQEVTLSADKAPLAGRERNPQALRPSTDIFSSPDNRKNGERAHPSEFILVSRDLFDSRVSSTYGESFETRPTLRVDLTKGQQARGYQDKGGAISYTDLTVDLQLGPALRAEPTTRAR